MLFPVASQAKLIAGDYWNAVHEHDLDDLFTLNFPSLFIHKREDDLAALGVDDIQGGRIRETAVAAKSDPAGLFAQFDAGDLLGWHEGGVENVHAAVGGITDPNLLFVRRVADAVAGAAVPLDHALGEPLH